MDFINRNLNEQLKSIISFSIDINTFQSQITNMKNSLTSLHQKYKDKTLDSPSYDDYGNSVTVNSLYLQTQLGPITKPNTTINQIQQSLDIQMEIMQKYQTLHNSVSSMVGKGFDIKQFSDSVYSMYEKIKIKAVADLDEYKIIEVLVPFAVIGSYILVVLMIISGMFVWRLAKNQYKEYQPKFTQRLSFMLVMFSIFVVILSGMSFWMGVYLAKLSEQCLSYDLIKHNNLANNYNVKSINKVVDMDLKDKSQVYKLRIQNFNKLNKYIEKQHSHIFDQCFADNDGNMINQTYGFDRVSEFVDVMVQQQLLNNFTDVNLPEYKNILDLRLAVEKQIQYIQQVKEQKIIDSNQTGTRNHYNSIAEMNMWSDYYLNAYLMCGISMDQFVFKFQDCPANYEIFVDNTKTPADPQKAYCIMLNLMDKTNLQARYAASYNSSGCSHQIDGLVKAFEILQAHQTSRDTLFNDLINELNKSELQTFQQSTIQRITEDQKRMIRILKYYNIDYNCRFLFSSIEGATDCLCYDMFNNYYEISISIFIINLVVVILCNRLFAFIRLHYQYDIQVRFFNRDYYKNEKKTKVDVTMDCTMSKIKNQEQINVAEQFVENDVYKDKQEGEVYQIPSIVYEDEEDQYIQVPNKDGSQLQDILDRSGYRDQEENLSKNTDHSRIKNN